MAHTFCNSTVEGFFKNWSKKPVHTNESRYSSMWENRTSHTSGINGMTSWNGNATLPVTLAQSDENHNNLDHHYGASKVWTHEEPRYSWYDTEYARSGMLHYPVVTREKTELSMRGRINHFRTHLTPQPWQLASPIDVKSTIESKSSNKKRPTSWYGYGVGGIPEEPACDRSKYEPINCRGCSFVDCCPDRAVAERRKIKGKGMP